MSATVVRPTPPRRLTPTWARALIIIAAAIVIPFFTVVALVIWSLWSSFSPPNVNDAVSHVESMRCVTWAKSFTEGGGTDVSPSAIIQVGLRPDCTAAEIDATYASLYTNTAHARSSAKVKIDYLVTATPPKHKPDSYDSTTKSTFAQLTMEPRDDLPSPARFTVAVDDWMAVRERVDPGAQISLVDPSQHSETEERFVANSTAGELRTLSTTLPDRLRAQAWKLTIPARGSVAFVAEDTAPGGGATIETAKGFPEPWLVDFGAQLNGAWPDNGNQEYVYVFRDPPPFAGNIFNELSARVFNVDASQAGGGGRPAAAETTTAWPALTAAVDAMSTSRPFSIGFALSPRPFTTLDEHPYSGNTIINDDTLAFFSSDGRHNGSRSGPDGGAITDSLQGYYATARRTH